MTPDIAILGTSPIALSLSRQLPASQLIILGDDADAIAKLSAQGLNAHTVDLTDDSVLASHGLDKQIRIAYCFAPNDATNVYLVLSLRELSHTLTIVAYSETEESRHQLMLAGADQVIDPHEISANRINEFIDRPYVADVLDSTIFSRSDIVIMEMVITETSDLAGEELKELSSIKDHNLIFVGIIDREAGDEFIFASGEQAYHLDPGDVLVLVGHESNLIRFREQHRLG